MNSPDPINHIFLSYAAQDRDRVKRVAETLQTAGWPVWWDRANLPAGGRFHRIIDEAIQTAGCVAVFWSHHSVDSDWVIDEADEGRKLDKLVPVLLDPVSPPMGFRSIHYVDLSNKEGDAPASEYPKLIEAVGRYCPLPANPPLNFVEKKPDTSRESSNDRPFGKPEPTTTPEIQRLLDEINHPGTEPPRRLDIGDQLDRLVDPRNGIGVDENRVPEIDWVEIPGGPFVYQEGETRELPTFWISRYPITNCQYRAFIDDRGYKGKRWWQELRKFKPEAPTWSASNRPRTNVNWYEAVAFTRWLSVQIMGKEGSIRLPSEEEWEKAARGERGFVYPWGNEYHSGYANVNETRKEVGHWYLNQTSAVGLYPHGASPYQIHDLSGTVWEWCLNKYDAPDVIESETSDDRRVLRGGSWLYDPVDALADLRDGLHPERRNYHGGFRIACSDPTAVR